MTEPTAKKRKLGEFAWSDWLGNRTIVMVISRYEEDPDEAAAAEAERCGFNGNGSASKFWRLLGRQTKEACA